MFNRTFKSACFFTLTCAVVLMGFRYLLQQPYRHSDHILNFSIFNFIQPRTLERGLQYLPEHLLLKDARTIDAMRMSVGKYSKIIVTSRRSYALGEEIKVKIILYDVRGKKMLRGGDYLRLWMENVKVKAAVSGKVMDNDDGTYSGIVRAMWSGEAEIGVMILGRREEIVLIYQLYNKYHTVWYNYGEFSNGVTTESSECSVTPFSEKLKWCNLTADNAGFSWFCVKPKKPGLSCDMWVRQWSTNTPRVYDSSSSTALQELWPMSDEVDSLPKSTQMISGTSDRVTSPETACNNISPEVTWNRKSPQGFFYKDQWHSTLCTDTMKHTPAAYKECLRGRTLYLHGDSTSRNFLDSLNKLLGYPAGYVGWHLPMVRSDPEYNLTLSWYAHELPFYHGRVHYSHSVNQAQHILLDKIPSDSRDIIILYLYVHFTLNHPGVFKVHIQRLVRSVQKLIARAPSVTVAFRGPHAFTKMDGLPLLHSYWGLHYMDILHEEFASLQKNVLNLNYWDMTMARLPDNMHVEKSLVIKMIRYMMSIVCHRD